MISLYMRTFSLATRYCEIDGGLFFVQSYMEDKLKFEIRVDGSMYPTESAYFYHMSSYWGGILFLIIMAVSIGMHLWGDGRIPLMGCIMACMFVCLEEDFSLKKVLAYRAAI